MLYLCGKVVYCIAGVLCHKSQWVSRSVIGDWLIEWVIDSKLVAIVRCHCGSHTFDWLIWLYWLIDWFDWLIDWLMTGWFIDWLSEWVSEWVSDRKQISWHCWVALKLSRTKRLIRIAQKMISCLFICVAVYLYFAVCRCDASDCYVFVRCWWAVCVMWCVCYMSMGCLCDDMCCYMSMGCLCDVMCVLHVDGLFVWCDVCVTCRWAVCVMWCVCYMSMGCLCDVMCVLHVDGLFVWCDVCVTCRWAICAIMCVCYMSMGCLCDDTRLLDVDGIFVWYVFDDCWWLFSITDGWWLLVISPWL